MSYEKRRYRFVGGKLEKAFNGSDADGWVETKAEAYAAVGFDESGNEKPKRRRKEPAPVPDPDPAEEPAEIVTGIVETESGDLL